VKSANKKQGVEMVTSHLNDEIPFLNTCRWLSAAVVAYGHVFLLVYISFSLNDSVLGAAFVVAAKMRYLAVVVFFVISGHLIGGGFLVRKYRFSWMKYSIDRFARIYAPLIPAVLLTVVLDHVALNLDPSAFIYTSVWPTHVIGLSAPIDNYSLSDVTSSIFSLESIAGQPIGSNAPLWSLGLEWCFYFIFPLIFIALKISDRFAWQVAGVLLGATVLWLVVGDLASTWLIWCSGALSRRWLGRRGISNRMAVSAMLVGVISIVVWFALGEFYRPMLSVVFGTSLALILQNRAAMRLSVWRPMDRALADMSYSLYITHVPVAVFCVFLATTYAGMPVGGYHSLPQGLALLVAILTVCCLVAWLFSVAFERRTPQLRTFLQSRLDIWTPAKDSVRVR
jgi:peptidoglycan/LPS O-acetylase OafA/YrhL